MRNFISLATCLVLAGCSLKPFYEAPQARFNASANMLECMEDQGLKCSQNANNQVRFDKQWWRLFNDVKLNELVEKALANNTDLRISFLRFEQAAQTLGIDRSDLFPKLDASAGVTRSSTGKNANSFGARQTGNNFNMGLNLSYELDLWGKYRDGYFAASKAYEASAYDFETARLSLVSNVVKLYFNAINLTNQVQILEEGVQDYTTSYELRNEQFKVGAIGEYELLSFKAQLESARAQLVSAKANKDNNDKALMILVSANLDDILYATSTQNKIENFKVELPQGISSEILLQRPDIQAALARLEQRNYLVGVARTAFLPNISLTGLLGFQSTQLNNLVENPSVTWNGGASALMPIFHWGEINANVNLAKLSKDEAFLNYESTLKTAFGEVRTALVERQSAFMNEKNYADLLTSQEKIFELSQIRYDNGSISLNDLLSARSNYLNAKLSYENSVYTLLSSVVDVIKAFGGGFNATDNYERNLEDSATKLDMSFRE
ncbi:TolC family protein [Campylobacter sp. MIT 12-5580]|uniref:efflux transporter outer membrane subunit n=1 Tax=Campylobacter sp. MIT 12-5580 TaxID=2040651 RepID=UPI0010F64C36|nr:TolC family protein [Campylobacter sp. MIT 12-5580]TKX28555.1 TolC family protein [Campylobacter sp. MIT 12-5580]